MIGLGILHLPYYQRATHNVNRFAKTSLINTAFGVAITNTGLPPGVKPKSILQGRLRRQI